MRDFSLKINSATILAWALSLTLLVDFCNGLLRGLGIGTIFRALLLVLCVFIVLSNSRKKSLYLLLVYGYIALNLLLTAWKFSGLSGLVTDIKMAMRVCTYIAVFLAIAALYENGKFTSETLRKVILCNLLYTPLLFMGTKLLGIGSVSYTSGNVGFKSVFMSLNSVNTALIVMYAYAVYQIFTAKKYWLWLGVSVYVAIPLLMLGTKTALGVAVVVPAWFALTSLTTKRGWRIVSAVGVLLLFAAIVFGDKIMAALSGILARQQYLFKSRDFFSYLFSGRNWMLERAVNYYFESNNPLDYLIGQGYYCSHHEIALRAGYASADAIPIEMDWADLIMGYGPAALIFTYGHSIYVLVKNWKYRGSKTVAPFYFASLVLLAFSALAGHVYTEAISSTFLAVSICGVYLNAGDIARETNIWTGRR